MKLTPLSDLIIIEPDAPEQMSAGGILFAPSAQEEAKHGTVVAVGPGKRFENGYVAPMDLRVGDRVAFSKYAKEEFKHEGRTYLTMHEADVIGVVNAG